jgi:chorismate synthase
VGEPVFGKLQQSFASAMLSIGAVKGFDYGMGFRGVCARGSSVADEFISSPEGKITTSTNHSGGIQGGISNGMDITFRVAVKPTPTIARPLHTVDAEGNPTVLESHGRHDPCILMRVPPVIEAMAAIALYDAMLQRSVGAEIL